MRDMIDGFFENNKNKLIKDLIFEIEALINKIKDNDNSLEKLLIEEKELTPRYILLGKLKYQEFMIEYKRSK